MLPLAVAVALFGGTVLPATGVGTYYAPGVMEQVHWNRTKAGQQLSCPECVGMVAMLYPEDIGKRVYLRQGPLLIGPLLVVDCATPWDRQRLTRKGWLVDVSWQVSRILGMQGPEQVTLLDARDVLPQTWEYTQLKGRAE